MTTPSNPPLALQWNRAACDAIYYTKTSAPRAARALAMVHTAMYDAWTCYAEVSKESGNPASTTTLGRLKRPKEEWTAENRQIAFSFAAHDVLKSLFWESLPQDHKKLFSNLLNDVGGCSEDHTEDCTTPQGIGSLAARLVLESRMGDGASSEHDFEDYTGYEAPNPDWPKEPDDIGKWQPLSKDKKHQFRAPHWGLVRPFALGWGGEFRPEPPIPAYDCEPKEGEERPVSRRFMEQAWKVVQTSACLTEKQKLMAEYWAGMHEDKAEDAPFEDCHGYWTVPPAQCCRIARNYAVAKGFRNERVIRTFFALGNALLDTSIAVWDAKHHYGYCRPFSAVRWIFGEDCIEAWGGPCKGKIEIKGKEWDPYLDTPASPEYPAAYSAFVQATADIIDGLWADNKLEETVEFAQCSSVIEPKCTPAETLTLKWSTLHEAAEQAGLSRLYGGVHFASGDACGRDLGRQVARRVLAKVCGYFDGTPYLE